MCSRRVDAQIHPDVIESGAVIALDVKEHQIADIEDVQIRCLRAGIFDQDDPGRASSSHDRGGEARD